MSKRLDTIALEIEAREFLETLSQNIEWRVEVTILRWDCIIKVQAVSREHTVHCKVPTLYSVGGLTEDVKRALISVLDYCVCELSELMFRSSQYRTYFNELFQV